MYAMKIISGALNCCLLCVY